MSGEKRLIFLERVRANNNNTNQRSKTYSLVGRVQRQPQKRRLCRRLEKPIKLGPLHSHKTAGTFDTRVQSYSTIRAR